MTRSTILEALTARGRDSRDALAFEIDGESLTFGQLFDDATWISRRLASEGLHAGGRCAIVLPTSIDLVRAIYGVLLTGAAAVVVDPSQRVDAIAGRVRTGKARLALATTALAPVLAGSLGAAQCPVHTLGTLRDVSPSSGGVPSGDPALPCYLQLTSGTTGEPRAAVISHRALMASLTGMESRYGMTPDDVLAGWLPMTHGPGLVRYVFGAVSAGCPAHLTPPSALQFARWLELIPRAGATVTSGPDFAYHLSARVAVPDTVRLTSLRVAVTGGESIRAATIRAFESRFGLGDVVQPAYGLSEATMVVTACAPGDPLVVDDDGTVSCGRPMDGVEVRLVDANGDDCAPGVHGEIVVRGDVIFDGYLDDEEGTARALRDGWLYTGDIGFMDDSGRLYPYARDRALIKRAGSGLAPREVEEPIERLPGVLRAAAVGVRRDGAVTEDLVVVVESPEGDERQWHALAAAVERTVVQAVAVPPSRVLIVVPDAIPRGAAGKVRYVELQRAVTDPVFLSRARFTS